MTRSLVAASVLLAGVNVGLVFANASADLPAQEGDWGQCVCVNGSNPGGPSGSGQADCWVVLASECGSPVDCSCEET
jgi:hypothetical protein